MESNYYKFSDINAKIKYSFSCIYKLTSPSGKIYIGQTQCLYDRVRRYRGGIFNKYMKRAVEKYGSENIILEILERDVELKLLDEREQFYLDALQPFGNNGYNICREASTTRGRKRPSEEMKGLSDFNKTRIGELNHFYGKKHSEETKQKQREAKLGKKKSKESVQKTAEKTSKCIKQIDPITREVINEFSSLTEASKKTGIVTANISIVATKIENIKEGDFITYSAGGFLWIYCDSELPNNKIELGNTSKYKSVRQLNLKTKELVAEFESIVQASKETGICADTISKVARKKKYIKNGKEWESKSAGGYDWEFY